jgi:hypothetical protein
MEPVRRRADSSGALNFIRALGRALGRGREVSLEMAADGAVLETREYPSMGEYLMAKMQIRVLEAMAAEDLRGRAEYD